MSKVVTQENLFGILSTYERRLEVLERSFTGDQAYVPVGAAFPFIGYISGDVNTNPDPLWPAPPGFLLCNGDVVLREVYPRLAEQVSIDLMGNFSPGSQFITGIERTEGEHTLPATSGILAGWDLSGPAIALDTTVLAVASATTLGISQQPVQTGNGLPFNAWPWGAGDGSTTFALPNFTSFTPSVWIIRAS